MRLTRHELAALAAGSGGPATVERLVASRHGTHALLLWGVQHTARARAHPQAARARFAFELIRDLQKAHPEAAGAVLRHPSVGAWARSTLDRLNGGLELPGTPRRAAEPAALASVAAAVAVRAGVPCAIEVPAIDGTVTLPSLGSADLPEGPAVLRQTERGTDLRGGGAHVRIPRASGAPAPGWHGLRPLPTAGPSFLLDDVDPFRVPGVVPAARLDDADLARWRSTLAQAWHLLARHHWTCADEIRATITVITPLPDRSDEPWSATSPAAFGSAAISAPPDPVSLAVTLAHEVQHAKLVALMGAVELIDLAGPGGDELFYAPWRDDPRPLGGLLHGAYAHLGIAGFWRRQRHVEDGASAVRAHAGFARWRAAGAQATRTLLDSGRLTRQGREFTLGMRETLLAWSDEPVPAAARRRAERDAARHQAQWRRRVHGAR
ncbi:HEXXH motif domain-containing protein [Spirillospora sp. CA-294931]|uniref:HEXXH motif domain-containing protein n=1 Tax=Spirillospora sp. CA-294931 TaxID=3240042 RepID=UPI003D9371EF